MELTGEGYGTCCRKRVARDDYTYTLVFGACGRVARCDGPRGLRLVREFVREMTQQRVIASSYSLNAAMSVCAKAVHVHVKSEGRSDGRRGGASVHGCLDMALSLYACMEVRQGSPRSHTTSPASSKRLGILPQSVPETSPEPTVHV